MNFVFGLPRIQIGFGSIFVVVDHFIMTDFIPYHKLDDASIIYKLLFRDVVKLLGVTEDNNVC